MKKTNIIAIACLSLIISQKAISLCPSADLNGDCRVNLEDLYVMASEWLMDGLSDPNDMIWVYIDDPGVVGHEGFTEEMSKYETTNAQYCHYLNSAVASGDITVTAGNVVLGANGSNDGEDFVDEPYFYPLEVFNDSQITYTGGIFKVITRNGYDMGDYPVIRVTRQGALAFCNYYGYRLPTEWEWQAVADYDGTYTYACGTTIDHDNANYEYANPLGLPSSPYTTPVTFYPAYGYGLNDMAGNVNKWTSSVGASGIFIMRSGAWNLPEANCAVTFRMGGSSHDSNVGFRVCR